MRRLSDTTASLFFRVLIVVNTHSDLASSPCLSARRVASGTLTQRATATTVPRALFSLWGLQTFSAKILSSSGECVFLELGKEEGRRREEAETSWGGGAVPNQPALEF